MPLLFFEIEVVTLDVLYLSYSLIGLVGFGLGLLRWYLGIPMLVVVLLFGAVQYVEITDLYDYVIRQEGRGYIAHNVIAPLFGVLLSLSGIGLGFFGTQETPPKKKYANTTSNGRI
jgi:hypothetical protein